MLGGLSGVPKFKEKNPKTVIAHVWFKNGDHPGDNCKIIYPDKNSITQFEPFLSEGEVVRRFRVPYSKEGENCKDCGEILEFHGWIDSGGEEQRVCPGDWIITEDATVGKYNRVKRKDFQTNYYPEGLPQPLIPRFYR